MDKGNWRILYLSYQTLLWVERHHRCAAVRQGILIKDGIYIEAPAHHKAHALGCSLLCEKKLMAGQMPFCLFSDEAVALLGAKGYRVRKITDGVCEWQAAGLPVERPSSLKQTMTI